MANWHRQREKKFILFIQLDELIQMLVGNGNKQICFVCFKHWSCVILEKKKFILTPKLTVHLIYDVNSKICYWENLLVSNIAFGSSFGLRNLQSQLKHSAMRFSAALRVNKCEHVYYAKDTSSCQVEDAKSRRISAHTHPQVFIQLFTYFTKYQNISHEISSVIWANHRWSDYWSATLRWITISF